MKVLNLTPHTITLFRADHRGQEDFPVSGHEARCEMASTPDLSLSWLFPAVTVTYGRVMGIPADLQAGDVVIVSTMAAQAILPGDVPPGVTVVAPDSGPSAIRVDGNLQGVTRFISYGQPTPRRPGTGEL
jgi:hypothetical protein